MPLSFTTFALPLNDKSFLWVLQLSLEKLKTALMPNLVGGGGMGQIRCTVHVFQAYWFVPEKIHSPPTDGILENLAGGGVEDSGNPGGRGG